MNVWDFKSRQVFAIEMKLTERHVRTMGKAFGSQSTFLGSILGSNKQ